MTIVTLDRLPLLDKIVCEATDPVASLKQRRFRELVLCLASFGSMPVVPGIFFGSRHRENLQLFKRGVALEVRVDWMDGGLLVDGLPVTHFRIEITVSRARHELRVSETMEAAQAVAQALTADGSA